MAYSTFIIREKNFPKWLAMGAEGFYRPEVFKVSPEIIQWTINMMLQTSIKTVIEGNHAVTETDFRKELRSISVPTLLLHGDADQSVPVNFGRMTAQLIPKCQYKEYTGAPHGFFFTHRDSINQDIRSFIGQEKAVAP